MVHPTSPASENNESNIRITWQKTSGCSNEKYPAKIHNIFAKCIIISLPLRANLLLGKLFAATQRAFIEVVCCGHHGASTCLHCALHVFSIYATSTEHVSAIYIENHDGEKDIICVKKILLIFVQVILMFLLTGFMIKYLQTQTSKKAIIILYRQPGFQATIQLICLCF